MFGEIKNIHGERIDHTFHQGDAKSKNLVLLGHGVTGNKDRPFLVTLAEALAAAGLNTLRFSFTGNGASGGRFADATISKEVADLGSVLDACAGRKVCYIGHSMGGAVGVLRASQDPRIRWLVSLAGMVRTAAFAQREFGTVKPGAGESPVAPRPRQRGRRGAHPRLARHPHPRGPRREVRPAERLESRLRRRPHRTNGGDCGGLGEGAFSLSEMSPTLGFVLLWLP